MYIDMACAQTCVCAQARIGIRVIYRHGHICSQVPKNVTRKYQLPELQTNRLGGAWGMRAQGGVDRINWRTCVVCRWIGCTERLRALYNQNGKKIRFKANPNLRDVVKKSKPENDTKNEHGHQSRPQMMPNLSLEFCSPNKCLD